jgi:hypothetical protein
MAAVVLDTGALIAIDRGDRSLGAALHEAARHSVETMTSSVCVAEAWRDPTRQARLARALTGILEHPLDPSAARRCGLLLARSGTSQVADAAVALLAQNDDVIVTSDACDIQHLLDTANSTAHVRSV